MAGRPPTREGVLSNEEFPVDLSHDVSPSATEGSPETETYEVPFDAEIVDVIIGFPAGTQNAVPMNLGVTGQRFVPFNEDEQWIAFEDFTYPFKVRTTVQEGSVLTARFFNLTSSSKFINCVPQLREL